MGNAPGVRFRAVLEGITAGMYIGTSVLLVAVGAILRFAVTVELSGIKLDVVGSILIAVGVLGLVVSLLYAAFWSDRRATVYEGPVPRDRRW